MRPNCRPASSRSDHGNSSSNFLSAWHLACLPNADPDAPVAIEKRVDRFELVVAGLVCKQPRAKVSSLVHRVFALGVCMPNLKPSVVQRLLGIVAEDLSVNDHGLSATKRW